VFSRCLDRLCAFLLAEPCAECGRAVPGEPALFCARCGVDCEPLRRDPQRPVAVDGVPSFAAFRFRGPVQAVLHRFKYEAQPELARRLAGAVFAQSQLAERFAPGSVLFVPVPIHPERLAERGYNQSALLATRLAERAACRVQTRALRRLSHTRQQVTLSRLERAENLRGQIAARHALRGRIVLVDDVLTTGATAKACFEAIRSAGGEPNALVTVAIAD
jgi:ComF family protein